MSGKIDMVYFYIVLGHVYDASRIYFDNTINNLLFDDNIKINNNNNSNFDEDNNYKHKIDVLHIQRALLIQSNNSDYEKWAIDRIIPEATNNVVNYMANDIKPKNYDEVKKILSKVDDLDIDNMTEEAIVYICAAFR